MIISDDSLYNNDGTKVQFEDLDAANQPLEQLELNYPAFDTEEKPKEPQFSNPTPPPIPLYDLS